MITSQKLLPEIINEIKKSSKIPVYPKSILSVLDAIRYADNIFWIVRYAREPFNLVLSILTILEKKNLVSFDSGKVKLTEKGKKLLDSLAYESKISLCSKCNGRLIIVEDILDEDVVREFIKIQVDRPKAIQKYDQGFVSPKVTLARVAYMHFKGDLKGRELLVLGDDDLVSIAAGLTGLPKKIVVVDIDERLIEFICKKSEEYGLNVIPTTLDLREPLPDEMSGKFDVFHTDPVETILGFKLFIGRGISSLKGPRCAGYFHLTLIESSLDKWRELQRILLSEFNVVITDLIPDFSEYTIWEYFEEMDSWKKLPESLKAKPKPGWYVSSLFRIETLQGSKGFNERVPANVNIYTDEEYMY